MSSKSHEKFIMTIIKYYKIVNKKLRIDFFKFIRTIILYFNILLKIKYVYNLNSILIISKYTCVTKYLKVI